MNDSDLKLNCALGIVKHTDNQQFYWMKLDAVKLLLKEQDQKARADERKIILELLENKVLSQGGNWLVTKFIRELQLEIKQLAEQSEGGKE